MATPAEVSGHLAAVQFAAATEADLEACILDEFDEDDCRLGAIDFQDQIDQVFGVAGERLQAVEIAFHYVGVPEFSVVYEVNACQHFAAQSHSSARIAFVELAVDISRTGARVDEARGDTVRFATR